jgi:virginiamycin B lyase
MNGSLWFTGQTGVYGRLDPSQAGRNLRARGQDHMELRPPLEDYYTLAGSYLPVTLDSGKLSFWFPTPGSGTRRVWSDRRDGYGSASGMLGRWRCMIHPVILA